jgi:amidase
MSLHVLPHYAVPTVTSPTMLVAGNTWRAKAKAKTQATLAKIPNEWRLPKEELDEAGAQRDITGSFIEQYLDESTFCIIKEEATTLVSKLQQGQLTARQVTLTFCKSAAIAHQIVCSARLLKLVLYLTRI